ncbi:MAG: VWA domain-containing protein [Acidobacteria bacterium]|nr:VWA domain-containing protein [Acidobacteriota bacterium]
MKSKTVKSRISLWVVVAVLVIASAAGGQSRPESEKPPENRAAERQDPQQQGVVRVDTVFVTVPVIITDRFGQFVTGLDRSDFSINEDGKPQEISTFSSTEAPFNVALLIDTSRSTHRKLSAIRKAALTFVKQLQPNDRVMIVTFDDSVRFVSDLTSDRQQLQRAIDSVRSSYATSLYDAIYKTINEKLAPLSGRKAIVVLTDGVDTASKITDFDGALELVSTTGIISYAIQYETRNDGGPIMKPLDLPGRIGNGGGAAGNGAAVVPGVRFRPDWRTAPAFKAFAAGYGLHSSSLIQQRQPQPPPVRDRYLIATDFMRALALQSGARYLRAETIESTSYAFALIARELRHQYTLAYYSSNEQRDGRLRSISVRTRHSDLVVRSRQAYRAPRAE